MAGLAGILPAPLTPLSPPAYTLFVVPALAAATALGVLIGLPALRLRGLTLGIGSGKEFPAASSAGSAFSPSSPPPGPHPRHPLDRQGQHRTRRSPNPPTHPPSAADA